MKISVDPMPLARERAIAVVNSYFDGGVNSHRAHAHRRKKEIATAALAGKEPTPEFTEEASLRGQTAEEFARLIVSKPDPIDAAELRRQKALFALDAASSPAAIQEIIKSLVSS